MFQTRGWNLLAEDSISGGVHRWRGVSIFSQKLETSGFEYDIFFRFNNYTVKQINS